MKINILIRSLADLDQFAKSISDTLFPSAIIGLEGTLGSGKTTFTKYLAKHLGVKDNVSSPTFTILKTYEGRLPLYHMDVYRLEGIGYDFELDDFIYGNGVSVIEWYPYIVEMLPKDFLKIRFDEISEQERELTVEGSGVYEKCVQAIGH